MYTATAKPRYQIERAEADARQHAEDEDPDVQGIAVGRDVVHGREQRGLKQQCQWEGDPAPHPDDPIEEDASGR